MKLKELYDKWESTSLVLRILCGLVIGLVLALVIPGLPLIPLLGTLFVGALKAMAPLLVLFLVIAALSRSGKNLGSRFKFVISLYLGSTIIATIVATILSFAFPVTVTLTGDVTDMAATGSLEELVTKLLTGMVSNPVTAITEGNYLCILFWGVVAGLVMRAIASETTLKVVDDVSSIVTRIIRIIISFAPFGILGLIYDAVSSNGMDIFYEYGALIAILVASMLIVILVTNPILGGLFMRRNPYPLQFKCLKESAVTAFFTRSSAANIPVNMSLCEKMGLDKDFYSVSIPLGATINMNGAAITITVMTLAAVHTMGVEVSIGTAIVLCLVSVIAACGASGVAGGSLLLIPLACSMFGIGEDISMQLVAIGFIIGVIQDSLETALNSSADVYFTAVADMKDRKDKGLDSELNL